MVGLKSRMGNFWTEGLRGFKEERGQRGLKCRERVNMDSKGFVMETEGQGGWGGELEGIVERERGPRG